MFREFAYRAFKFLLLVTTIIPVAHRLNAQTDSRNLEVNKLQNYLTRLGLDDLSIVVLRQQLDKQPGKSAQLNIATKLANYYTKQIQQNKNNIDGQLEARQQLSKLQQRFAELKHPKFAVAVLSADFSHAQSQFFSWVTSQQTNKTVHDQLAKKFAALNRQWTVIMTAAKTELDRQNAVKAAAKTPELHEIDDELVAIISQLEFIGGWQKYYLSILTTDQRDRYLAESRNNFLSLIGVESLDELTKLKPEELELEISWVSRSVLGLAMVSSAESNRFTSKLFEFLSDARVPSAIRSDVDWWEFQSAALARQWKKSTEILRRKLQADSQSRDNPRLWLSGLQCVKLADDPAEVSELVRYGLQGLARENQFQTTQKFCDENPSLIDDTKFVFQWLSAQREYEQGEKNTRQIHFANCKKLIEKAIKSNEPTVRKIDLARCRYLLGWTEFRLGNYERSTKLFRQASLGLRSRDPDSAAKALWIRIVAIRNSSKRTESDSRKIVSALNEIRRLFPGTTYDEKAAFELSKLRTASGSIRDTIQKLQKIPPDNSAFAQAQLEISRLYFESLKDPKLSEDQRSNLLSEFCTTVDQMLKKNIVDQTTKSKSAALVIESLLAEQPPNIAEANKWIQRADDAIGKSYSKSADLAFQKFRIAKMSNKTSQAVQHAQWLASTDNTNRSYKIAALIFLAKHHDQLLAQTSFDSYQAVALKTEKIYEALSGLLGNDSQTLKTKPNARTAFARLADLRSQNGKTDQAIQNYEKLRQALPNYQRYILRLAQLKTDSGQTDNALELWRKLASGTKPGSESWYESKFNVIKIVGKNDPPAARSILNQTQRLSPNMPDAWKAKFDKLATTLKNR